MIHQIKYPTLFGLNSPIESIHRNISLKINIDLTIWEFRRLIVEETIGRAYEYM